MVFFQTSNCTVCEGILIKHLFQDKFSFVKLLLIYHKDFIVELYTTLTEVFNDLNSVLDKENLNYRRLLSNYLSNSRDTLTAKQGVVLLLVFLAIKVFDTGGYI